MYLKSKAHTNVLQLVKQRDGMSDSDRTLALDNKASAGGRDVGTGFIGAANPQPVCEILAGFVEAMICWLKVLAKLQGLRPAKRV